MTREEFIKKYELNISVDGKIIRLFDEKAEEYGKLVEQHRKLGDLIEFWLEERDNNKDIFYVIDTFATEQEHNEYYKEIRVHIRKLIENHIIENDLDKWVLNLKKNDNERYKFVINEANVKDVLKNIYKKIFDEHRKTGDLIDYLWEFSENFNLSLKAICASYYNCQIPEEVINQYDSFGLRRLKDSANAERLHNIENYPLEHFILRSLLTSEEDLALDRLVSIISHIEENKNFKAYKYDYKFTYIFKLSQSPKDSIEYRRYQKIRNKITKTETLEKLDKSIAKTILISRLKKIGIIAGAALILILVGAFAINRAVTKNARMAKKEAQRIERVKVKKTKDIKKAQEYDLRQLEKLSAKKLSKQELLVQTAEPTMYVIAPMTYDTKKFSQDNSHDSAMFGFKTVDNSVERLGILETCITDFENKVDELTGVSFLDRSKISQIEKEHKFQLGDWSNNKKTAEVGKALNANILLFLDKFTYVDAGSGQYRFEAKFVDVNTMQSSSFVVAYKNPKKKIVTPEVVSQISFRDFTPISTKNDSFDDELYLKTQNVIRTVQKKDMKIVSPLGAVTKLQISEFDVNTPKTEFVNASSISFDGFGELELDSGSEKKSYSYTFDANEIFIERNGYNFYTDGKIGVLTVSTDGDYEKFTVFTNNNRDYYLRLGSVELEKAFVNYYLQMVKQ